MEFAVEAVPQRVETALDELLELERTAFAAKVRAGRAVLGLSQERFAQLIGLTQKSVHRIEHGAVQPTRRTVFKIQQFWLDRGIAFENLRDGGFRLVVDAEALNRKSRHQ